MKKYYGVEFEGKSPKIHENSYLASGAIVKGDVRLKEFSSLWHHVSLRGDVNYIEIGEYTNIQDNAVVHVSDDHPCIIGDYVTIGHGAIVHACTVEEHCLIGMGSIILDGAVIGKGSIIGAGALVTKGMIIPPHSLVMGSPAKVKRSIEGEWDQIHAQALKYKTLWTKRYKIFTNAQGEEYHGEHII